MQTGVTETGVVRTLEPTDRLERRLFVSDLSEADLWVFSAGTGVHKSLPASSKNVYHACT